MPRPRPLLVLQSQGPKLRMMRQRVVVGKFSLSPQKNDGFPCAACCSSAALGNQSLQITHVPHCKCKKMQLLNGKTDENCAKHGKQLPSWQHHNINHHRKKSSFFPESEFDCCNPLQPLIQRGFFQTHPRCHKRNILSSLTPRVRSQLYSWSYNFANARNCRPGPIAYWSGLMTTCCNLKLYPNLGKNAPWWRSCRDWNQTNWCPLVSY